MYLKLHSNHVYYAGVVLINYRFSVLYRLKTPPATPLFPSLEMEANAAQPVVQRELPIIHPPPSRFAGHKESKRSINGRAKSPNPKPKVPSRSITPSHRPVVNNSTKVANYDPLKSKRTNVGTADMHMDFLTSNLSQKLATTQTTKPRSRGVSPLARSTIPIQYPTPPNRSSSASRGRAVLHQNASTPRQSCSPRARGRRQQEATKPTQPFLGSKMVEKVMNARKSISSINDQSQRDTKQKLRGSTTKHLEIKRDSTQLGVFHRRREQG
ncbi:mediator of DNA damage checkpoint protein 1-like isoform X2 [Gossypium australe]|uniref:Mediator of DNA damage checkpoint protein 1-like isoform X2 n=1 Tax=Gossypium australe TaxID=47621 RepID=A0A5B6X9A6_9ROSI|nr:mediator of DNA damage checkpoint protein 1-like isoform X2 [Gossypium australe]